MEQCLCGVGVVVGGVATPTYTANHKSASTAEGTLVMEMEMQMDSCLKDSNVGVVGVVVTPTDTANHELAAQASLKLRIAVLIVKAAYQFKEAQGSRMMNEIIITEEAISTVPSLSLTMPSESELSESGSNGEGPSEVDEQRHEIRVTSSEWILLLTSCGIEILASAFDQVSSPRKPHYALIGMLLAIVAVLVCISELLHNGIKERVVLRRRGMLWCVYYPPPNNKLFGTFPEIFGLGLAIVQCICSAVQYHFSRRHATTPIKLSPLPVVFAFSLVISKLVQGRRYNVDDNLQNGT